MILRRYTNANGDQQEICLSQEDWAKVTDESLDIMLGFKQVAPEPVVESAPEPVAEEAPAEEKAPAKKRK